MIYIILQPNSKIRKSNQNFATKYASVHNIHKGKKMYTQDFIKLFYFHKLENLKPDISLTHPQPATYISLSSNNISLTQSVVRINQLMLVKHLKIKARYKCQYSQGGKTPYCFIFFLPIKDLDTSLLHSSRVPIST